MLERGKRGCAKKRSRRWRPRRTPTRRRST